MSQRSLYNIYDAQPLPTMHPTVNVSDWISNYKEQNLESNHDQSMATLGTPDECLVVAGPSRLASGTDSNYPVIGMASMVQYTESSQIQPMKAIGSRRHVFSKSNLPIQGSIGRLVIAGRNLLRALYQGTDITTSLGLSARNAKISALGWEDTSPDTPWLHNLEEDLFRVPFGLGFVFSCPGALATKSTGPDSAFIGGEYLECCVLQSRTVSVQTGQTIIMDQVQFMADRALPWTSFSGKPLAEDTYTLSTLFPDGGRS